MCAALRLAEGEYLFLVKGNQPQLFEDLRLLFVPLSPAKRAGEELLRLPEQQAQTTDKGHGRLEIRSIFLWVYATKKSSKNEKRRT